jgi:hypothetical protein
VLWTTVIGGWTPEVRQLDQAEKSAATDPINGPNFNEELKRKMDKKCE